MDKLRNFGFLLKDLSRRYVLRFEQHASEISLTLTQCKALVQLEKNEGASQVRLAELTDVEPMTMVRILDRMEADTLIERRPDPEDRRARRLYLTDRARPLLGEIWRLADLTRTEMFAGVGKEDRVVFMRVLEQLHQNVSALEGPTHQASRTETPKPETSRPVSVSAPAATPRKPRSAARPAPTSTK